MAAHTRLSDDPDVDSWVVFAASRLEAHLWAGDRGLRADKVRVVTQLPDLLDIELGRHHWHVLPTFYEGREALEIMQHVEQVLFMERIA